MHARRGCLRRDPWPYGCARPCAVPNRKRRSEGPMPIPKHRGCLWRSCGRHQRWRTSTAACRPPPRERKTQAEMSANPGGTRRALTVACLRLDRHCRRVAIESSTQRIARAGSVSRRFAMAIKSIRLAPKARPSSNPPYRPVSSPCSAPILTPASRRFHPPFACGSNCCSSKRRSIP